MFNRTVNFALPATVERWQIKNRCTREGQIFSKAARQIFSKAASSTGRNVKDSSVVLPPLHFLKYLLKKKKGETMDDMGTMGTRSVF